MYIALLLILFAITVWLLQDGVRNQRKGRIGAGIALGIFTFLFFWLMSFWGEMLWFDSIGFPERFWTIRLTRYGLIIGGFIIGALIIYGITFSLKEQKTKRKLRWGATIVGGIIASLWGNANWAVFLKFMNGETTGVTDPFLDKDVGFYFFTLPFLDSLYYLLLLLIVIALGVSLMGSFRFVRSGESFRIHSRDEEQEKQGKRSYGSLYLSAGLFLLLMAFLKYLHRFYLMYSEYGVVNGPGWTDINVRLPAFNIIIAITIVAALAVFVPAIRQKATHFIGLKKRIKNNRLSALGIVYAITFILWFIGLTIIPAFFQWLKVEPNELRLEEKYIAHNITFTNNAFGLDKAEEREFPVSEVFNSDIYNDNLNIFNNVRLWDYRALDAVYKQFQEIRLYYEFNDVDIDRYHINDDYRQVMVSAREMEQRNLPQQSKTFINKRFKYTHGFGVTLINVSEFTENGLPNLLVKDIPPQSKYGSLEVEQPRIYYGELTRQHVIVGSEEEEFDYPKGEENEYFLYDGEGGVPISNFWRKFLFAWKFDGTRLLFSGYPTENSRIMFHRQIRERVKNIAPFLYLDNDPYVTLINGHIYWIIDAYTASSYYPYSESLGSIEKTQYTQGRNNQQTQSEPLRHLHRKNYVRNSVKVFVNAFTGKVDLYIFDEEDPLVRVWNKILPELFKKKESLPHEFMRHVRYPVDFLLLQGLVYAKYHMTDPDVFYNQEDLWIRATEKYYGSVQAVEPYYVMWELPETNKQEFILMLPFTPKNRQVSIGWIAGMCDMENHGRFLAYKFPKEKRVLGPQQVETKIDQDSFLSGQLSLWDQRGSRVIRGNVLAIPVDKTIIYVEPIYLQAETAAYPELRLVAVMHNDKLSYAEDFETAIRGLFMELETQAAEEDIPAFSQTMEQLIQRAKTAFDNYIEATGNRNYQQVSRSLEELENALNDLSEEK
jgi:uncharacterized membrane protein (UPF0182 family)